MCATLQSVEEHVELEIEKENWFIRDEFQFEVGDIVELYGDDCILVGFTNEEYNGRKFKAWAARMPNGKYRALVEGTKRVFN